MTKKLQSGVSAISEWFGKAVTRDRRGGTGGEGERELGGQQGQPEHGGHPGPPGVGESLHTAALLAAFSLGTFILHPAIQRVKSWPLKWSYKNTIRVLADNFWLFVELGNFCFNLPT